MKGIRLDEGVTVDQSSNFHHRITANGCFASLAAQLYSDTEVTCGNN